MPHSAARTTAESADGGALAAYLFGELSFESLLGLQRRLVYDIGGDRRAAALLVFAPPTGITIGREGSRLHVRPNPEELHARGWPVRWVSRGGGTLLHLPGQVACYPLFALDHLALTPAAFLRELEAVVLDLLRDHGIAGATDPERPGVRVGGRLVAHIGIAVRDGISSFGLTVNVAPDLEPFREVKCDGDAEPMTSIQREAPSLRARVPGVRQRLVELIAVRFRCARINVFHSHPSILPSPTRHASTPAAR